MSTTIGMRLIPSKKKARSGGDMKKMARTAGQGEVSGPIPPRSVSEKVALLRANNCSKGIIEWYMIELTNTTTTTTTTTKKNINPTFIGFGRNFCNMFFCATLGSTLYVLGGDVGKRVQGNENFFSRKVFRIEVAHPDEGFKKGTSMLNGKYMSQSVALGGKLYVFGGTFENHEEPWGESFDPKKNKWECIKEPPIPLPRCYGIYAIPYDEKQIMVGSYHGPKKVLLYNVESNSWAFSDYPVFMDGTYNSINRVKVGNIVYWLHGWLFAYDLNLHKSYSGPIKFSALHHKEEDFVRYPHITPTPLFHLDGNDFYFFWLERTHPTGVSSIFHCTKFWVVMNDTGLDATTIYIQSYVADHHLSFVDGMPLDGVFVGKIESKVKENFSGSSSGEKVKRSYASALVAGIGGQTGGKHV